MGSACTTKNGYLKGLYYARAFKEEEERGGQLLLLQTVFWVKPVVEG